MNVKAQMVDCIMSLLAAILILHVMSIQEQHSHIKQITALTNERDIAADSYERCRGLLEDAKGQLSLAELDVAQLKNAWTDSETELAELAQFNLDLTSQNQQLVFQLQQLASLKRKQARDVVGLKGDFKRLVLIFDTSDSMNTPQYHQHRDLVATWIQQLDFEEFNVIAFSDTATIWKPTWQDATRQARDEASGFVRGLQPNGGTATKAALLAAMEMPGIDTIIIFSDGAPSDAKYQAILSAVSLKQLGDAPVTINAVAIGSYFKAEYGEFLSQLARLNSGQFLGR